MVQIELKAVEREKIIKKEELTKEEIDNCMHEENFDCQSGGNKLEEVR